MQNFYIYLPKLHCLLLFTTATTSNLMVLLYPAISWLGHLERMEEDRMPKKIFTQELEGTRKKGKTQEGWKEEVERDLQVLGVRRWRELVADRKKWKDIVRQAKAHSGL